ncbi:MAG: DUF2752 domain-containing protein [Clostridia bacterium]|nr:DUF2752 domain-containing protein [Clostridia bacterium]
MKERFRKVCFTGAALIALGCAYLLIYLKSGFAIPCVFHLITGLQCPGCGTTRMLASLVRLDFRSAWHYNPVVLAMSPMIVCIIIRDTVQWIKNGRTKSSKIENYILYVMFAVLVIFGIVRNII